MLIVFNKGNVTRDITVTDFQVFTADGEEMIGWVTDDDSRGEATPLSEWEIVYVLHPTLIRSRPLSNLEWIKGEPVHNYRNSIHS